MSADFPSLMPGAAPFYHPGDSLGCLCIHGFTANPSEMRWLGAHLAAQGMTVYGVRLAGHGTDPRDLARCRWQDWLASVLDGYFLLRSTCNHVVAVGHSMGAVLALALATRYQLAGVAALAAPMAFPGRMAYARWLRYVQPFTDQADSGPIQRVIRVEQRRRGEAASGRVRYDQWSTAAVAQLYALVGTVAGLLPQVRAPLLLIDSKQDPTVSLNHADQIAGRVGSRDIERHTLERSGHILTQDVERELVFGYVADFARRCEDRATQCEQSA
jgi:carboxylesterase